MPRTLKQLAQEALDVQNACNLSGVVHGFARAMGDLMEHTKSTDERNRHPIAVLWADKVAHLTGTQDLGNDVTTKAYSWAYDLINEKVAG
jgi:hypothetical protein